MTLIVRIRLTVARQSPIGMSLMETQSVVEQSDPGSEQSRLGRHAHRRTEDSILSIMAVMIPPRAHLSKRHLSPASPCEDRRTLIGSARQLCGRGRSRARQVARLHSDLPTDQTPPLLPIMIPQRAMTS
ncbi:hypothetical protein Van01_36730 [Micromonospora andamanensis]|uniref:Uncharacterized protein n=1 Tax=Micromonospora andamanensis TaxID=1287068 RepID=A0ABQ4HXS9_9ACTN|nr:hypothetical protein Van01_36730 [Micromonospora andamanensis]